MDQKAYWATTVTINIARGTPLVGEYVASVIRGGSELGALTLGRWYSAHVFLLPMVLVTFIVAHILLMRKHGISGPIRPQTGASFLFFPSACHSISGEGGNVGPDLSEVGRRRNSTSLQRIVSNPASEFPNTRMPAYGARLTADQMEALVQYLSKRR